MAKDSGCTELAVGVETVNETTAAEAEIEILLDSITDETSPEMSKDSKSTEEFILEQIKR